jgi:hypothetical protein
MMAGKRGDNSPEIESKPELKNPDRRHVLGVAALAAAFAAGQVDSAAAQSKKKAKPAKKPAATESAPATANAHGGLKPPQHPIGDKKYKKITDYEDLKAAQVYADAEKYREDVSAYALMLRQQRGLDDEAEFRHIIRLQVLPGFRGHRIKSGSCGCGCS